MFSTQVDNVVGGKMKARIQYGQTTIFEDDEEHERPDLAIESAERKFAGLLSEVIARRQQKNRQDTKAKSKAGITD